MRKVKEFTSKAVVAGQTYDLEHNNLSFDGFGWKFSAIVTAGTTPRDDASFRAAGTPELSQAEEPILRMQGASWRHLAAFSSGGYSKVLEGVGGNAALAEAFLDLRRIMPGAMVSGKTKAFVRGTAGALADYASVAPTAISGTFRARVRSTDRDPNAGHLRPRYTELSADISGGGSDIQKKIDYDQSLVTAGLFVRVFDNSLTARSDGIVRAIRVDVTRGGQGSTEILRSTWGNLRADTARKAGFSSADWDSAIGTAFLPLEDERSGDRLVMAAGDSLVIHIDTAATVEDEFTAVAAAASDLLYIVRIDHEQISPAGSMDSGEDNLAPVANRTLDTNRIRRAVRSGVGSGPEIAARIRRRNRRG